MCVSLKNNSKTTTTKRNSWFAICPECLFIQFFIWMWKHIKRGWSVESTIQCEMESINDKMTKLQLHFIVDRLDAFSPLFAVKVICHWIVASHSHAALVHHPSLRPAERNFSHQRDSNGMNHNYIPNKLNSLHSMRRRRRVRNKICVSNQIPQINSDHDTQTKLIFGFE